jgi:hypothetical protein
LFQPTPKEVKERRRKMQAEEAVSVPMLHRAVPLARQIPDGLRALSKDRLINPQSVERYLEPARPLVVPVGAGGPGI